MRFVIWVITTECLVPPAAVPDAVIVLMVVIEYYPSNGINL